MALGDGRKSNMTVARRVRLLYKARLLLAGRKGRGSFSIGSDTSKLASLQINFSGLNASELAPGFFTRL